MQQNEKKAYWKKNINFIAKNDDLVSKVKFASEGVFPFSLTGWQLKAYALFKGACRFW